MSRAHELKSNPSSVAALYVVLDLGWGEWNLAFTTGVAQKPRLRTIRARDLHALQLEIARAKDRFKLPADTVVISCYEAGRDGFCLHRCMLSKGVQSLIVDAASIEVNRRKRRAKTDRLDAASLVVMLIRWHLGERKHWRTGQAPSPEAEDLRQLHRELISLKGERTEHINRIKGLMASIGLALAVDRRLPERLDGRTSC